VPIAMGPRTDRPLNINTQATSLRLPGK